MTVKLIFNRAIIALICFLMFFLSGCQTASFSGGGRKNAPLSIVCLNFPAYDFTRQIVGDKAALKLLMPPGGDAHGYEPTIQDLNAIIDCDLFIYTGGESDGWVDRLLKNAENKNMRTLKMIECVDTLDEKPLEGADADSPLFDNEAKDEPDEHVWTAPLNADLISRAIKDALCELSIKDSAYFTDNYIVFSQKLHELDNKFSQTVNQSQKNILVFGDRFPFAYMAKRYGLECFAAFPGCSSETESSIKTFAFLMDKIKNEHLTAVFYTENANRSLALALCEETGAQPLCLHSCHNVSKEDFFCGKTYIDFMEENLLALKEALN